MALGAAHVMEGVPPALQDGQDRDVALNGCHEVLPGAGVAGVGHPVPRGVQPLAARHLGLGDAEALAGDVCINVVEWLGGGKGERLDRLSEGEAAEFPIRHLGAQGDVDFGAPPKSDPDLGLPFAGGERAGVVGEVGEGVAPRIRDVDGEPGVQLIREGGQSGLNRDPLVIREIVPEPVRGEVEAPSEHVRGQRQRFR